MEGHTRRLERLEACVRRLLSVTLKDEVRRKTIRATTGQDYVGSYRQEKTNTLVWSCATHERFEESEADTALDPRRKKRNQDSPHFT